MEFRFKCPCGKILGALEEAAGRRGRCPACGKVIRVPTGAVAEHPQAAERARPSTEPPSRPPIVQAEPPQREDAGKGVIVVADSTDSDLAMETKCLQNHGYTVYSATDGEEAVKLIREKKPALALLDLKLDRVSGFQVIKQVTDQFNPLNKDVWQIPFIMTCGKLTGRDRQYAISLGVKYYYSKPVTPAKLFQSVEKELGRFPSALRPH